MKIIMGEEPHLEVRIGGYTAGDMRQILIDQEQDDIRICDGSHVIKLQCSERKINGILIDDIYYWRPE